MSNLPTVKFRCNIADVVAAVQKHCGLRDVVIETDDDLNGIMELLRRNITTCGNLVRVGTCKLLEDSAIVQLVYNGSEDEERNQGRYVTQLRENFEADTRKLQSSISSA